MNSEILHTRLQQQGFESALQKAILSVLVAADIIRREHSAVVSSADINHNQYNILRILKGRYPEGYCRKDIIERMMEKAPDVTRLIDALVTKGLAERIPSAEDKRMSLTKITEKGLNELNHINPSMTQFNESLSQYLNSMEAEQLADLCSKIIQMDVQKGDSK